MTALSQSSLAQIRVRPQQTKLHLSLFSPSTVLACRVSGSPAKGDRVISYNTVTTGSFSNVEAGMTLLVGTSPGGFDVGKIRTKSAGASSLTVAENSDIGWQSGQYLTVIKYWEVWPVFPRIIYDPSNPENVIFYKDYDVAYTNQNSILGTFVCSGPHRAKYIDSGVANIFYSSSGTFNPILGGSVGHYWEFEGGSPSIFAGAEPGTVQYTTPGHYVTKHTVTGSNGCSDVSYRYVSVYPRPSANNPTTIQDFTIDSIDGSRDAGGYTSKIKIHQSLSNPIIPGTVAVVFMENSYGGTPLSLGGNSIGNEDIFFVGYVLDGTISYDYEQSEVEFSVGSITELMKVAEGFSISVEDSTAPNTWYKLLGLDSRRAMYHYLRWHSTVLGLADFQFVGTDYPIQFFDADRESLYDAINGYMSSALVGDLVSDRQGKMWAEVSAKASPTIIDPSIMTITKNDWIGDPSIQENINDKVSYLELGGIAYSGAVTGSFSALMTCAPGSAPSYRGKIERNQGLALGSQTQLNTLAGNVFANKNSQFPTIDLSMAGSYLNLDIAPQQRVSMNIAPSDTPRNVAITGAYLPNSVMWAFDSEDTILLPRVGFQEVISSTPGDTIVGQTMEIPNVPPGGGFSMPPFRIPNISPLALPSNFPISLSYFYAALQPKSYALGATKLTFQSPVWGGTPFIAISGTSTFTDMTFLTSGVYILSVSVFMLNTTNAPSIITPSSLGGGNFSVFPSTPVDAGLGSYSQLFMSSVNVFLPAPVSLWSMLLTANGSGGSISSSHFSIIRLGSY